MLFYNKLQYVRVNFCFKTSLRICCVCHCLLVLCQHFEKTAQFLNKVKLEKFSCQGMQIAELSE